jgi:hypothetical protein
MCVIEELLLLQELLLAVAVCRCAEVSRHREKQKRDKREEAGDDAQKDVAGS